MISNHQAHPEKLTPSALAMLFSSMLLVGCAGTHSNSGDKTVGTSAAVPRAAKAAAPSMKDQPLPAFPGAEGFGALASGGRNGRVIKVTSLAPQGPGTLQEALNQKGPRIIVFEVSGVIKANIIEVLHGDVTIAGQTAPGGGITIAGRLHGGYDEQVTNIIVRHLRVRPPPPGKTKGNQFDGIQFSKNSNMIFDHISVAFGVDETVDFYAAKDATLQWSTVSCSGPTGHYEGAHNYGMINGPEGRRVSLHHNLFAHHKSRNPALANGPAEVRNNVFFNFKHGFVHHNPASGPFNIVGNVYRRGPSSKIIPFFFDDENKQPAEDLSYFLAGNLIDDPINFEGVVDNPWAKGSSHPGLENLGAAVSLRAAKEFDFTKVAKNFVPITAQTASDAYLDVLAKAGALPRDWLAHKVVEETKNSTGQWGLRPHGDLMKGLRAGKAPPDLDNDGMADAWELEHGLDPKNGEDHKTKRPSGYTAIEEYINGLAAALKQSTISGAR